MSFEPELALDDKGDMSTATLDVDQTLFNLHQRVNYWQAMHARAVEREAFWKAQAQALEAVVRRQEAQLQTQAEQLEVLKAQVAWLQQQVFGRKSEGSALPPPGASSVPGDTGGVPPALAGRGRGQQRGAKGHGRQRRVDLPTEEIEQALPAGQQHCPQCGLPLEALPSSEDSEEIHWEVRVVRRVYHRRRYRPGCGCGVLPGIVTAPVVAKVIRKGLFSTGFWVQVLLEKYLFQRPLYRVRQRLALEGLSVSQGTLTGGLQRLGELIQPLYVRILERSRAASHWQMDETRWLVFAEVEGKEGHQWWLWVEAERCLRNPVVGRKNYYGSGAVWSGQLSAMLFTLFQTCLRNHLDPQQFLLAFFDACAQNRGQPPEELDEWLPWNLSETQKRAWTYPKQPP